MKKYLAGLLSGMMVMASVSVFADGVVKNFDAVVGKVQVVLNGERLHQETVLIDGTTYLPIRAVAEMLGLEVKYDEATATAYLDSASFGGAPRATAGASYAFETVKQALASMSEDDHQLLDNMLGGLADAVTVTLDATDDEMIYRYVFTDDTGLHDDEYKAVFDSLFDDLADFYVLVANSLKQSVNQAEVKVTLIYENAAGKLLYKRTFVSTAGV